MKFRPLGDRVLVKRGESQEKTVTGIYLPDTAKEKGQDGTVIAVGPGKADKNGQLIQPAVKVGDKVYFGKYAGTEISPDQIVIREEEILGIIEQ